MGDVGRAAQAGASVADAAISASAAKYGADLQAQAAANSLAFNQSVYNDTKANQAPYVAAGQTAINNLSAETAPGGSLNTPWSTPFSFSGVNLQNDPAYQFDLDQGTQAMQRSAAAQGGLVSGGALKDLNNYAQGYASNQYQQSYQNALSNYQTAYNVFENNQANSFNRQAAVAGIGQTSTNYLGSAGQGAAANYANVAQTGAAGQAAGMVGVSNAIQNGINNTANWFASQDGSSYGGGAYAPPSAGQWGAYDAGSTPAGTMNA